VSPRKRPHSCLSTLPTIMSSPQTPLNSRSKSRCPMAPYFFSTRFASSFPDNSPVFSRGGLQERFHCAEILFDTSHDDDLKYHKTPSVQEVAVRAVTECEAEFRAALLSNIYVTGQTARIKGLPQRLQVVFFLVFSASRSLTRFPDRPR